MTKQTIRRRSLASRAVESSAPEIDQIAIAEFAKIADVEVSVYVKPDLETFILERYKLTPENYNPAMLEIIETLKNYVEKMKVGARPTERTLGEMCGALNLVYIKALRHPDAVMMFDIVLWFFSYHEDTTFRAELPYRGIRYHKFGTSEQATFYQHLTAISQEICDIQTRNQRLREMDFRGAIKNIPKGFEKHQAGLTSFIDYYTNF